MKKDSTRTDQTGCVDILRHGRTMQPDIFRGRTDDPLSEAGWEQMWLAVGDDRWDAVITSPLSRCSDFARQFSSKTGAELTEDERLLEYDFGDWDGKTYDVVMADQAAEVEAFFSDPYSRPPPNGECFTAFTERVLEIWHEVCRQRYHRATLLITHGGVIMTMLADVFGVDRLHGKIEMSYACRSRIRMDQSGARPRLLFHR
ncbi:MAG: histidine phosphatase family protein [Pseudomonadota bacterium]